MGSCAQDGKAAGWASHGSGGGGGGGGFNRLNNGGN